MQFARASFTNGDGKPQHINNTSSILDLKMSDHSLSNMFPVRRLTGRLA